jgi:hypothetical protein
MAQVVMNLNGAITLNDGVAGTVSLQKPLVSLSFTGTAYSQAAAFAVGTSPESLILPVSSVNFIYIKNTSASGISVTVTWTPLGQTSVLVQVLEPGSAILVVQAATGGGVSAISVQATATGSIEYVIGG